LDEAVILFVDGVDGLDADVSSQEAAMAPSACSSLLAFGEAAFVSTVITPGVVG